MNEFSKLKNKSGKHKNWYGLEYIKIFCSEINKDKKLIDEKKFYQDYKKQYLKLELSGRLELIANLYYEGINDSYAKKLKILKNIFGPPLEREIGMFTQGFYLFPVSKFVELYGEQNIIESLNFIEELTMRFTGEWAIRTLANAEPLMTFKQVKIWTKSSNVHIRRLASEGLRPKLPWGKKIDWVSKTPKKLIPIYTHLRNDPSLYVRKSVANSMGDIIKIDQSLAIETFWKWLEKKRTKENLWVIKHAIRLPVKKNDPEFFKVYNELK